MKISLVVIFNHRFDNNIQRLRELYSGHFSDVVFLVPFYDGADKDVISVYECSYQFPGYLIQAYTKLIEHKADYYLFIADDLILNPSINENNVLSSLNMGGKDVFFSYLSMLNSEKNFGWIHTRYSSRPFFHKSTSWKGSMPGYDSALQSFLRFFGKEYSETYEASFFEGNLSGEDELMHKQAVDEFIKMNNNSFKIPYPMARGYSDMFIIKSNKLYEISRFAGIFSAMNLFAEIALPTSIVLSCDRKQVSLMEDTQYVEKTLWGDNREIFSAEHKCELKELYNKWDEKWLYCHPIKLSVWK